MATGAGPQLPRRHSDLLAYLGALPGPRDAVRAAEDKAACVGNTLDVEQCWRLGVRPEFIAHFFGGRPFVFAEGARPPQSKDDYAPYRDELQHTLPEFERLVSMNKVFLYAGRAPADLILTPGNAIVKQKDGALKVRLVYDFSATSLNEAIVAPDTAYGTISSFVRKLRPGSLMSGLDGVDMFFHWLVAPEMRRLLGLRSPADAAQKGCFLFYPFGLGSSPGVNDEAVKELIRVVRANFPEGFQAARAARPHEAKRDGSAKADNETDVRPFFLLSFRGGVLLCRRA